MKEILKSCIDKYKIGDEVQCVNESSDFCIIDESMFPFYIYNNVIVTQKSNVGKQLHLILYNNDNNKYAEILNIKKKNININYEIY